MGLGAVVFDWWAGMCGQPEMDVDWWSGKWAVEVKDMEKIVKL